MEKSNRRIQHNDVAGFCLEWVQAALVYNARDLTRDSVHCAILGCVGSNSPACRRITNHLHEVYESRKIYIVRRCVYVCLGCTAAPACAPKTCLCARVISTFATSLFSYVWLCHSAMNAVITGSRPSHVARTECSQNVHFVLRVLLLLVLARQRAAAGSDVRVSTGWHRLACCQ